MTRLRPADPAVAAYTTVVRRVEQLIVDRLPRLPFRNTPAGLTPTERHELAQLLADAARIAQETR